MKQVSILKLLRVKDTWLKDDLAKLLEGFEFDRANPSANSTKPRVPEYVFLLYKRVRFRQYSIG